MPEAEPRSRTGPGKAKDGEPKFDLEVFDQAPFDRLLAAGEEGIFVAVMFFDGWALQEAHIRKVIGTLQDLPNVLYEVASETSGGRAIHQNTARRGAIEHLDKEQRDHDLGLKKAGKVHKLI